jgi:hypothetical protein
VTDSSPQPLGLLPKLVIVLAILLIAAGVLWHGVTWETFPRAWSDVVERTSGPLSFRFILQPSMAAIAAIHDGLKGMRGPVAPLIFGLSCASGQLRIRGANASNVCAKD